MRCPYCEADIQPNAAECPECHLSYSKTCNLFGAPPRMGYEVYDSTYTLTASDSSFIRRQIHHLTEKYPELEIKFVVHRFPEPHPLRTYAFWLFNAGELSIATHRGSSNHTIALFVDPDRSECAMIPGYGLEPYLDETTMSQLLDLAIPCFRNHQWSKGMETLLHQLDEFLQSIAEPVSTWKTAAGEY